MDTEHVTDTLSSVLSLTSTSPPRATAADIPPELFRSILLHVGNVHVLSQVESEGRASMISHLAACSLTCLYWAQQCRPMVFTHVCIRSVGALFTLSSLVRASSTLLRLSPIAHLVKSVHLVEKLGDSSWLHNLAMQPSLLPPQFRSASIHMSVAAPILDHDRNEPASRDLPSMDVFRLFLRLPRTVPPICYRCNTFTFQNCRFRTPHDLSRCLDKICFDSYGKVHLIHATWDTDAPFYDSKSELRIPYRCISGQATSCSSTVEAAWTAFTSMADSRRRFVGEPSLTNTNTRILLHTIDHQYMYQLSSLLFYNTDIVGEWCDKMRLEIFTTPGPLQASNPQTGDLESICCLSISGISPTNGLQFAIISIYFYTRHDDTLLGERRRPQPNITQPQHVTDLFILCQWDILMSVRHPWYHITDMIARLPAVITVQFVMKSREHIIEFVKKYRPALRRLAGLIVLRYVSQNGILESYIDDSVKDIIGTPAQ
ncbi:hypothetical protein BDY19DRAFT_991895 [Irpex rosettiformis]|uniref:Uncharacterized protein n=1 Tax=Irpex rosettiformis TaxID=378272 RepID=A0ACB8UBH8_9APHY|nr:hypothetical protein BDY19DRAFT_991895 [Irpex rosettiformis]